VARHRRAVPAFCQSPRTTINRRGVSRRCSLYAATVRIPSKHRAHHPLDDETPDTAMIDATFRCARDVTHRHEKRLATRAASRASAIPLPLARSAPRRTHGFAGTRFVRLERADTDHAAAAPQRGLLATSRAATELHSRGDARLGSARAAGGVVTMQDRREGAIAASLLVRRAPASAPRVSLAPRRGPESRPGGCTRQCEVAADRRVGRVRTRRGSWRSPVQAQHARRATSTAWDPGVEIPVARSSIGGAGRGAGRMPFTACRTEWPRRLRLGRGGAPRTACRPARRALP